MNKYICLDLDAELNNLIFQKRKPSNLAIELIKIAEERGDFYVFETMPISPFEYCIEHKLISDEFLLKLYYRNLHDSYNPIILPITRYFQNK